MSFSPTVNLTRDLVRIASVTPEDKGCQPLIESHLTPLGFTPESMAFGDVNNLWLRKGTQDPLLVLAGHTDVVPAGPEKKWQHPPFDAVVENGILHGRGVADMKGGLAAMVVAVNNFITAYPDHAGSIAFLITSDEEGPSIDGTKKVVEVLKNRSEIPKWCIIGEPSSTNTVGDTVKHGRRGSLTGHIQIHGIQGHVAYPHLADNPIHAAMPALDALATHEWDKGNKDFPPTSFQIVHIDSGTGATNVIPGHLDAWFNFRFSTEVTDTFLKEKVTRILDRHQLQYDIEWTLNGQPFLTPEGTLRTCVHDAIESVTGHPPAFSTAGGTSDGRFIATMGTHVVELGVCNKTIHQVNECVAMEDLDKLTRIYEEILKHLLLK